MSKRLSIVGGTGWVGKAVKSLFPDAYVYSRHIGTKKEVNKADVAFICVPTPYLTDSNGLEGRLDISIVEDAVSWLKTPLIVIRSTVNPGSSQSSQTDRNDGL